MSFPYKGWREDEEKAGFGLGKDHFNIFRYARNFSPREAKSSVKNERKQAVLVIFNRCGVVLSHRECG
jgi:hypothetical protein